MAISPVNPPVAPPPASGNQTPVRGEGMQVFREIVTAAIAIAILSVSIWMLADTYLASRIPIESAKTDEKQNAAEIKAKTEAYNRQKDVLLYALALLGTVTGYYLGRVPAEQRAQQAQQTANTAQNQLASATNAAVQATATAAQATQEKEKIKSDAKATLGRVLPLVAGAQQEVKTLGTTAAPQAADLARAQREIEELLQRLG